jgi:hypothetical protein
MSWTIAGNPQSFPGRGLLSGVHTIEMTASKITIQGPHAPIAPGTDSSSRIVRLIVSRLAANLLPRV